VGIIRRIFYVSSAGATALDFINPPRAHPSSFAGALHPSSSSANGHVVKTMRAMVMYRHGGPEVLTVAASGAACGSSGACGVRAWGPDGLGTGGRKGREGAKGVDVDYADRADGSGGEPDRRRGCRHGGRPALGRGEIRVLATVAFLIAPRNGAAHSENAREGTALPARALRRYR
jgi:hypothetical protein